MVIEDQGRVVQSMLPADRSRDAALSCLAGHPLASRFHSWYGRSGKRYLASVFPIDHDHPADGLPDLGQAVLIAVARTPSGRRAVRALAIERGSDWSRVTAAMHADADEWHVHLLAPDRAARTAAVIDLGLEQQLAIVA